MLQRRLFALVLLVALPLGAAAAEWAGTVVGVADGDTLTLLDASRTQHRIRIDGIDAPERMQPFGQRARQSLAELAQGRSARAECPKSDRYGRAVCRVYVDGVDVGLEQVRRGLAWHYVKYAHEQPPQARIDYARAEEQARAVHAGLWTATAPTPPWDYRREHSVRAGR
ncbi:MAG TPA: thermonuclease family protein [Burkholderiaceae bacterium]|nr:thermonuclease family protein [Burkholderiaceae bacterium]